MASWLVLDWVNDQFHILCAESSRKGVKVTRALTWTHPELLAPSTADRVGKALRDFLRSAKIAAAPVIVGLSRNGIFLKELKIPPIAAHEEASLVRFQTAKEMAEPADNYAIDYVPLESSSFERKVMAVATRRDIAQMLQNLCLAAGLKLHGVTPRLFGTLQALTRSLGPDQKAPGANELTAVLSVGQRWAELCFFRGERLLQAQALSNGPMLANEIKRNLAVFQAQYAANVNASGPDRLFLFSDDKALTETLSAAVPLPIQPVNPLWQERELTESLNAPSQFADAVGLAMIWSRSGDKPVNLTAPRRSQAPVSASSLRVVVVGAVFAVTLILAIGAMTWLLLKERAENRRLTAEKEGSEEFLKLASQERAEIDAFKEWESTTVPYLDELYDFSARFPFEPRFRINSFSATPILVKRGGKETAIARVNITGIVPTNKQANKQGQESFLSQLLDATNGDPHVKLSLERTKSGETVTEFYLKMDISKQDYTKYKTVLELPVLPQPKVIEVIKTIKIESPEAKTPMTEPEPEPEPEPTLEGGSR